MIDAPISRGVMIAGQNLTVDPRTGRCENHAKPFSKAAWNEVAKPHTLTVLHADGNESVVTIAGATHSELRDDAFVHALVTGQSITRTLTVKQWHACVMRLAAQFPDKVARRDGYKPALVKSNPGVVVAVRVRK